jgi:hypothetical protein
MLFLLVAGVACIFWPDWILCASGMGDLEDEPAVVWLVRVLGVVLAGIAVYVMCVRH